MTIGTAECPCCQAKDVAPLGKLPDSQWFAGKHLDRPIEGGQLYRCTHCLLKFRFPLESAATYNALYDNAQTTTWNADTARPDWDLIISTIDALSPRGARVLDFGCYSGGLLSRLDARYRRFGVEVNQAAMRMAVQKTSGQVWKTIEDVPTELRFDVIVAADVIEHIANPRRLIEHLGQRLTEEGAMIITTGDAEATLWNRFGANWWYCLYPEHVAFISSSWAERALKPHGWSIAHCERFRYRQLSMISRVVELVCAYVYGYKPQFFLRVSAVIRRWMGGEAPTSAPGNGASNDHILIVLKRRRIP